MGLKKLVQLKDDRAKKMINNSFSYDFFVIDVSTLAPTIQVAHLKSSKVEVCLSENPFSLFGKYFNLRAKDWSGLEPFCVVLSQSENFASY
jgi:hypothetical protein